MISDRDVARRVAIVCIVIALGWLSWKIYDVILQVFAACLVSLALHALAEPFAKWTRFPERYAVIPVGIIVFGGLGLALYLFGSTIQTQVAQLVNELPTAWTAFERRFHLEGMSDDLLKRAEAAAPSGETVLSFVQGFTSNLFQVVLGTFLVVVGGIYFAVSPDLYRRMFLSLWRPSERAAADRRLALVSEDLRHFLKAQLIAMVVVGVLTFIGLTIVGVPSSLALALFAGLAEFVPMIGPVMAAAPAVLIALTMGADTGLWTLLVFVGVQQAESNIITPLLQQRMVSLPPAVTLFAVVAFGSIFGALGVVLATPLTVVAFAAFKAHSEQVAEEDKAG